MKGKIFNAQEVQSMLNGSKVMFREVVKNISPRITIQKGKNNQHFAVGDDWAKCPYQVGQKIFCKENFCWNPKGGVNYLVDLFIEATKLGYALPHDLRKEEKNAKHMKQEHSRLTLLIKEIRVERLAEISCADYFAETGRRPISHVDLDCDTPDPRNDFAAYWNATHKKPGEKFEADPWVWCVSFEVINN